ncbi:MAG TPA: caspase family protein [Phycisphaerae bacterium]|nr:caspase family protein [Phycisphaerae bacterium]
MARHAGWVGGCVAVVLLGTFLAGVAQAQDVRYWAVICGVADYKTINDLNYTDDDAVDLAAALRQYGVWQGPDQIEVLIDSAASANGIRDAIRRMGDKANAVADDHDVFLFFFSGHGMQVVDASGDESDGIDEAICPYNTQFRGSKVANIITDDTLGGWLAALPDGDVVAILDTCFSGGMAEGAKGSAVKSVRNPNLPPQAKSRRHFGDGLAQKLAGRGADGTGAGAKDAGGANAVVLMACQEGDLSWETPDLANGVFSHFVISGLGDPQDGAPADILGDGNDLLSAEEEFDYASPETMAYAASLGLTQEPRLFDGTAEDTVLVDLTGLPPPPTAAFAAHPTSGPAPLAVTFTDESTGSIETWSWDFGDGATSAGQNPTHTYASTGTYTVSLTVTGPGGGSDTATAIVSVTGAGAEVVVITKAEYKTRRQELTVQAVSSVPGGAAVLTVEGYGEMTYNKRTDTYTGQFKPVADPGETITVTSSEGGSDTAPVTYR